jgi:hypothetical protein
MLNSHCKLINDYVLTLYKGIILINFRPQIDVNKLNNKHNKGFHFFI